MAEIEPAIFTNMCMITDDAGNILVQDRRGHRDGWSGLAFPGGHVEPGESFVESVIREVWEETGLTVSEVTLCGIKQWQSPKNARYVVLLFKTHTFSGKLRSSEEGEVFWIPRQDLKKYPLASGFEDMLTVFESDSLTELYYTREDDVWKMTIF